MWVPRRAILSLVHISPLTGKYLTIFFIVVPVTNTNACLTPDQRAPYLDVNALPPPMSSWLLELLSGLRISHTPLQRSLSSALASCPDKSIWIRHLLFFSLPDMYLNV